MDGAVMSHMMQASAWQGASSTPTPDTPTSHTHLHPDTPT